jgi:DNA-binding winged helix-turn-helix (wHTH) protein/tetratricopeptide (TPR) repeat protein
MVEFPPFRLDPADDRLWKGDKQLTLRRKPFAILRYLVANPRRLVTHQELIDYVWGGSVVSESAMRTHLHELRQVLGEQVIETVIGRGYRFTAEVKTTAAPQHATIQTATRTIVGRDTELAFLHARFDEAQRGHRQLVFVTGEPGIGKTTLVDSFIDELESRQDVLVMRGASIEQHGTPEAYLPIIEMLSGLRTSRHGDSAIAALIRYAPTFVAELPQLVPDNKRDEIASRARTEAKPVRELIEALEALAAQHTVVIVLEDLQWADVATLDLVSMLGARRGHAQLLVLATARRAESQTVSHPLHRVLRTLVARAGAKELAVEQLANDDVQRYLDVRFPHHALPGGFTRVVATITAGTPLFLVTLIDDLVRRGMLVEQDGVWRLGVTLEDIAAHRPDSVRQLVDMQLDALGPEEQRVLEAGSVLGTELSTALVAAALEKSVEHVDEVCDGLARRSLFLRREGVEEWPGGELHTKYALGHRLVQDVLCERSAPTRRARWHRLVAERLESAYGADAAPIAHVLALHFDQGHVPARAVHYYLVAAERAEARFASSDALSLCRRARELVVRLPADRTRDELELAVLGHLAQSGFRTIALVDEPLEMFERMVAIARAIGDPEKLVRALTNSSYRYSTLAQYSRAREVLDEVDALLGTFTPSVELAASVKVARVMSLVWSGELAPARVLIEDLLAAPVPFDPRNPGLLGPTNRAGMLSSYDGFLRWASGEPNAALRIARGQLAIARQSGDAFFLGAISVHIANHLLLRGESPDEVRALTTAVLASPEAAPWHAPAATILAWADAQVGAIEPERIAALLRDFHERKKRMPLGITLVSLPTIAALRDSGHVADARAVLDEMLDLARKEEKIFLAELLRLRGELVEAQDRAAAAQDYLDALAHAKTSGTTTFELRAAINLARLWRDTPRSAEARRLVEDALQRMGDAEGTSEVAQARDLLR